MGVDRWGTAWWGPHRKSPPPFCLKSGKSHEFYPILTYIRLGSYAESGPTQIDDLCNYVQVTNYLKI